MKLWLVWRDGPSSSHRLVDICLTEADAEARAAEVQRWLENYHGPTYYPCHWDQELGAREFRNQYGDRVSWEERETWVAA